MSRLISIAWFSRQGQYTFGVALLCKIRDSFTTFEFSICWSKSIYAAYDKSKQNSLHVFLHNFRNNSFSSSSHWQNVCLFVSQSVSFACCPKQVLVSKTRRVKQRLSIRQAIIDYTNIARIKHCNTNCICIWQ